MNKLLVCFLLISGTILSQLPAGINPATLTKDDLDKYGVTQDDVARMMSQYGTTPAAVAPAPAAAPVAVEEVKAAVAPAPIVKPEPIAVSEDVNSLYGRSFFANKNLEIYQNATHGKAAPNYILGTGDEISVSIWGYSEHSGVYTVAEDGSISPKMVGKIYLKGQTFEKAQSLIAGRFGQVYDLRNSQISIQLNYSKVIRVNIVGEVNHPGTYSVPAINPVFNILSLAGGITENGSVRKILVKREGKIINELDVYSFLKDPTYKSDFFLMDNDYLVVGLVGPVVRISGSVKRPMKYELKEKEGIAQLIHYAGGLLPSSYTKHMNVYRFQNDRDEMLQLKYDSLMAKKGKFDLYDGDRIDVLSIPSELRNRVKIQGPVNIPGDYVYKQGMTVKDLILMADGLQMEAFIEKAYINRVQDDLSALRIEVNLKNELNQSSKTILKEKDVLTIFYKKDFKTEFDVTILGSVRNPKSFAYSEGMTLGDLIFMAGGILPQASTIQLEISRISEFDQKSGEPARIILNVLEFDKELLSEKNKQIPLKANDIVFVRNVPNYSSQKLVKITGEVKYPGQYTISERNETLTKLIERAGGTTEWAFLEGAYLRRFVDGKLEFIVLDLNKLLNKGAKEYDYTIQEGDELVIPLIDKTVTLSGSVEFPKVSEYGRIFTPYEKGKRAKFYIKKYGGGFTKDADKKLTYVETAGGKVKRTKNFGIFKVYPKVKLADRIVVVRKVEKEKSKKKEKEEVNWNKAIENITIKLTGLTTLYILVRQINP